MDLFGLKKQERETRDFIKGSSETCIIDYKKWRVRSTEDKYELFTAMHFTNSIDSLSQYFQGLCETRGYNVSLDSIVLIIDRQTKWYFSGLRQGCNDPESDPMKDREKTKEMARRRGFGAPNQTYKQISWHCLSVENGVIPGLLEDIQREYVNYASMKFLKGVIKEMHKYDD